MDYCHSKALQIYTGIWRLVQTLILFSLKLNQKGNCLKTGCSVAINCVLLIVEEKKTKRTEKFDMYLEIPT